MSQYLKITFHSNNWRKKSEYKDPEIESEKLWHFKNTTEPVIVGGLGMIKKGTGKHINTISGSPNLYEKKCTLRNCSSPEKNNMNMIEKYHPKEAAKIINTLNTYNRYFPSR